MNMKFHNHNNNMDEESHLLPSSSRRSSAAGNVDGTAKNNHTFWLAASFVGGLVVALALTHARSTAVSVSSVASTSHTNYDDQYEEMYGKSHQSKEDFRYKSRHSKSSSSSIRSKYDKFQHLGFQIYTGGAPVEIPGLNGVKNPECFGLDTHGQSAELSEDDQAMNITNTLWQCYLGHRNPAKDVKQRLQIMTDAVEKAYDVSSKDEKTLKVFLAPEFFFRGIDGAYMFSDTASVKKGTRDKHRDRLWKEADGDDYDPECGEVCHILKGLEQLVANKKYKDWIFLFGTVIVSEQLPTEDKFDFVFYNFAPVYRGYDPEETDHFGKRFLVPKRYLSQIDFLTPARLFNSSTIKEVLGERTQEQKLQQSTMSHNPFFEAPTRIFYDQDVWLEYKDELNGLGYTMVEYDWLIMDDITFTIEVCVDHFAQTAINTYLADTALGKIIRIPKIVETFDKKTNMYTTDVEYVSIPSHMAQLSLVSSAGMTIEPKALVLAENGTILLQDGQSDREGTMDWIKECDWFSWHFEGGTQHVTRSAKLTNTEISFEYHVHAGKKQFGIWDDLEDASDTTWKEHIKGAFTATRYEPKITAYSPQEIAKVYS